MSPVHGRASEVRDRPVQDVSFDPIAGEPRRRLVPLKTTGSGPPIFLVPGQFGDLFQFKRLVERIRDDIPVYGFEARGLYGDVAPIDDFPRMAAEYIDEMRTVQPRGPHHVAGFSVGGKVVYEIGRQLARAGDPPELLIIDYGPDRWKPRHRRPLQPLFRPLHVMRFHWQNYRGLNPRARTAYRRAWVQAKLLGVARLLRIAPGGRAHRMLFGATGSPPPGRQALIDATARAEAKWSWLGDPFPYRFSVFRGAIQDPGIARNEVLEHNESTAPAGIDIRHLPGHHGYMFVEPHVYSLIAEIEDWVDRVAADPSSAHVAPDRSAEPARSPVAPGTTSDEP